MQIIINELDNMKFRLCIVAYLFCAFFFLSCVNKERDKQLQQREAELVLKEKDFALKWADYQNLIKMRDSLMSIKNDTVTAGSWPPGVAGIWNSKIICTESNCNDYVVGDIRTDQWEFGYDSAKLITKVTSNNKPIRTYNASYKDSAIHLEFSTDSLAEKQVSMNVLINDITSNKMKGMRTVKVSNKCEAKFSVELIKSNANPQ